MWGIMSMSRRNLLFHVFSILLLIVSAILSVLVFPYAFGRIVEGGRDVVSSVVYYVNCLFGNYSLQSTVVDTPKIPYIDIIPFKATAIRPIYILPDTWDKFKVWFDAYIHSIFVKENLYRYLLFLLSRFNGLSYFIMMAIPTILILYLINTLLSNPNKDRNKETVPLKIYKKLVDRLVIPIVKCVRRYIAFVKVRKYYQYIFLCIWAYNFNAFAIVLEFVAFYLYYLMSFDFLNLYIQIYKLFIDLSVMGQFIPVFIWIILGLYVFDMIRRKIALEKCKDAIKKEEEFAQGLPIVIMATGTMGSQKTTFLTDLSIIKQKEHRETALKKLIEWDLKFPMMAWIEVEDFVKMNRRRHSIFNLYGCRQFVDLLRRANTGDVIAQKRVRNHYRYNFSKYKNYLFGYSGRMTYDNDLVIVDIFDAIKAYMQLYLIYSTESSLIVSNYAIRSDEKFETHGNFPKYDMDFMKREPKDIAKLSKYSHIIPYDAFRLGKRIDESEIKYCIEFGITAITEIGKERGNQLEARGEKKDADTANTVNDLFNYDLKLCRHHSTVDYYPFFFLGTDEQRPESWGADARDTAECFGITNSTDYMISSILFGFDEIVYNTYKKFFQKWYVKNRNLYGSNSLTRELFKTLAILNERHYVKIFNRYAISNVEFMFRPGTLSGEGTKVKYPLVKYKIHNDRFATDALSGYYDRRFVNIQNGLQDVPCYGDVKATMDELHLQGSYLIQKLDKVFDK